MSIQFPLPPNSRFLPADVIQSYVFSPSSGHYVLKDNDKLKKVFEIQKNCMYLIERVSFCTTIPEDNFLRLLIYDSTVTPPKNNLPRMDLFKDKNKYSVWNNKMSLTNYRRDTDISTFIYGDDSDDFLMAKFFGELRSSSDTVGYDRIDLILSFSVFCLDQNTIVDSMRRNGKL